MRPVTAGESERGGQRGRRTVTDAHRSQDPAKAGRPPSFELLHQDREELLDADKAHDLFSVHHRQRFGLPAAQNPRGLLHVSGAEVHDGSIVVDGRPLSRDREYVVAGTDWELEPYGGYVDPDWGLRVRYDLPTIVRDALEEELATGAGWPVR